MATIATQHRADQFQSPRFAMANQSIVAGGAGDNTEVDGDSVDRMADVRRHLNANVVINWSATLQQDETLTLQLQLQDSADDTVWADFGDPVDFATVATGPTGGGTVNGVSNHGVDIAGTRRYIRTQITPDLSAADTDTADISAVWILAGADRTPA